MAAFFNIQRKVQLLTYMPREQEDAIFCWENPAGWYSVGTMRVPECDNLGTDVWTRGRVIVGKWWGRLRRNGYLLEEQLVIVYVEFEGKSVL